MTETPPVPDEFDSEEELQQYIDQLHDQIEFLEEELTESEKEKLELKEELNEIEDKALHQGTSDGSGSFSSLMEPLQAMQDRIEEFEEGYLDEDSDYGLSKDDEGVKAFSEAVGADITQDPEDFKEELEDS